MKKQFPTSPGVYLHYDNLGNVIYVGKAKNLKKRIASYFSSQNHDIKTSLLVKQIARTEFIVTNNEVEALLLENRLIKKHKPKFNIDLKETARYFYIQITNEDYPRILITRHPNKRDRFFGPYTRSVVGIRKIARDLFKLRSCGKIMPTKVCMYYDLGLCYAPCEGKISKEEYNRYVNDLIYLIKNGNDELRLQYETEMKKQSEALNFEKALEMRKRLELLDHLAQKQLVDSMGRYDQDAVGIASSGEKSCVVVLSLKKGVMQGKKEFKFLNSRNLLDEFLKTYYSKFPAPNELLVDANVDPAIEQYLSGIWGKQVKITRVSRGTKSELVALAQKNAYAAFNLEDPTLIEIKEMLELDSVPVTIDCFDISNIGDSVIVGACVAFKNRIPNKGEWRLYNITPRLRSSEQSLSKQKRAASGAAQPGASTEERELPRLHQDDFRSIQEVVSRRYKKQELPDLIIIDGGQVQVQFALQALRELGLAANVVGLAKKEETIVFPNGRSLKLNRSKAGSKLIIKIRDTVHKFAIEHSRNRYKRLYKSSQLDDIAGIGNQTKFKLLRHFGSVEGIKKANLQELSEVVGVKKANLVMKAFQ